MRETASNKRDDGFVRRLKGSSKAVFCVAERLHSLGYDLKIPALKYPENPEDWKDYVDGGDIFVSSEKATGRVEVKHVTTNFTCLDDWPFDSFIVSNKSAIDRKNDDPLCWYIVNPAMTHVGIIYPNTRHFWFEKPIYAKNTQKVETFYVCPKERVIVRELSR